MDNKFAFATIIALIMGAVLFLAVFQPNINIPPIGDGRQITTQGTYTVEEEPDFAKILINFESFGDTAEEAQQENADAMFDIIRSLKKEGLTDDDLETTNYNINPQYEWRYEQRETNGYRASHTLEVTIDDYENVGKYLDAAVSAANTQIFSVRFELTERNQAELKSEAIYEATRDARDKADAMASGLGMKVVRAVSASDSYWDYGPVYAMAETAAASIEPYHEQTRIQAGDVEVTARINAVFEIA
jgi:uncharacterized protein YggE